MTYSAAEIWLIIAIMGIGTFLIRFSFLGLIGDRAMHPEPGVYREIWDLGDRWCRWTELPFVFAMWVAREGLDTDALAEMLQASRDDGLKNLDRIAADEAATHGLTNEDLVRYFVDNLHFQLGPAEELGLEAFRQRAVSLGLIPEHQHVSNDSLSTRP